MLVKPLKTPYPRPGSHLSETLAEFESDLKGYTNCVDLLALSNIGFVGWILVVFGLAFSGAMYIPIILSECLLLYGCLKSAITFARLTGRPTGPLVAIAIIAAMLPLGPVMLSVYISPRIRSWFQSKFPVRHGFRGLNQNDIKDIRKQLSLPELECINIATPSTEHEH